MKKLKKEEDLYPFVERYLKSYYRCFRSAMNTGVSYSRVDVVGIRDVGGELCGEIEIFAVEVKRGNEPFARAAGQASGYKVYANRVYLADYRFNRFSQDEIQIASHLGIGLIQIAGKTCKEILTSPYHGCMPKMATALLERLAVGKCQFCGTFFEIGKDTNKFANLVRVNADNSNRSLNSAYDKERGLMFWNFEISRRRYGATRQPKYKNRGFSWERRFICPSCIQTFFMPARQ